MEDAIEQVVRLLEEEPSPFTPERIAEALRKHGLEVEEDLETFAERVLREGARKTARVLEGLWKVLEVPRLLRWRRPYVEEIGWRSTTPGTLARDGKCWCGWEAKTAPSTSDSPATCAPRRSPSRSALGRFG